MGLGGGGGGVLRYVHYLRRLGPFLGFVILNFNKKNFFLGGGGYKNKYFWGYGEIVDIWGSSQNWSFSGGQYYTF